MLETKDIQKTGKQEFVGVYSDFLIMGSESEVRAASGIPRDADLFLFS